MDSGKDPRPPNPSGGADITGSSVAPDDELAIDGAEPSSGGELEGVGGDAVDVAQATVGFLVDESDGIGGKQVTLRPCLFQAMADVLGGVARCGLAEGEAGVDAGPERAVLGEGQPLPGLGQTHEYKRE